nr:LytTR family DNA-binding domain-containing protein [Pedobacter sp. ASV2]
MIRTLIIEDEPAVRKEIIWLLEQEKDFNLLGSATNVNDALTLINATQPQLVLMDIQLTDGTAFDILSQVEKVDFRIIFITAYNHFAIKAIKYGALDYLLKPLDEAELKTALQKIAGEKGLNVSKQKQQLEILEANNHNVDGLESRIVLHTLEYLQIVQLKDIVYCRSDGSYTHFVLADGQKITISKPLKFYDELLPEKWFLRPHQSYLVNITYIDKFLKVGELLLKDKTEIPVSDRRKEFIIQRISHLGT